jgi:hypothetical protein
MSLGLMLLASFASAATVKPAGWTASSSAPPADGSTYEVTNLSDAKQGTVWIEGDTGSGLGSWATADLGGEKTLKGFTIWAGCWYSSEFWARYNRPKVITVELSDGSTQEFTLADEQKPQTFTFSSPKKTSSVKIKVKAIFNGNTFNDTAISEIRFDDGAAPPTVAASAMKASTTFPPDNDANYEPANTEDGILDSMWCEGNKTGDGTNEWVEFTFGAPTAVSKLQLRNGNASSFSYYMKSNRPATATLTFGDGSTESITIKDAPTDQTISFAPHTTDKVKLTFTGVKKGSEFNDMCISEAWFLP